MRFRITVREPDTGREWTEDYDKPLPSLDKCRDWATNTIKRFNATLYPSEKPRELVGIIALSGEGQATDEHDWRKTNSFTIIDHRRGGVFDTYRCNECGITGKRFGLSGQVNRDPEFKADGYARCSQAKKLLERRARMRRKRQEDISNDEA